MLSSFLKAMLHEAIFAATCNTVSFIFVYTEPCYVKTSHREMWQAWPSHSRSKYTLKGKMERTFLLFELKVVKPVK